MGKDGSLESWAKATDEKVGQRGRTRNFYKKLYRMRIQLTAYSCKDDLLETQAKTTVWKFKQAAPGPGPLPLLRRSVVPPR